MVFNKLFIFPLIYSLLLTVTFFITYGVAVSKEHVPLTFPYVSDTGAYQPESSLFTFSLVIAAIILALMAYFRSLGVRQWAEIHNKSKERIILLITRGTIIAGLIASIGIIGVASIQVSTSLFLHLAAALVCFTGAIIYMWLEVVLSYLLCPHLVSPLIFRLRVVLCLLVSLALSITAVAGVVAYAQFDGHDITKWTDKYKGYVPHLYSSVSEWVTILGSNVYILTYVPEMYKLRNNFVLVPPQVHVLDTSYEVDSGTKMANGSDPAPV